MLKTVWYALIVLVGMITLIDIGYIFGLILGDIRNRHERKQRRRDERREGKHCSW